MCDLLDSEVEKRSSRVDESHGDGIPHKLEHIGEELFGSLDALLQQSAFAAGQSVQSIHEVHFRCLPRLLQSAQILIFSIQPRISK
jgi:hypothetical protein